MIPKTVDVAGVIYRTKEVEDVIIDGSTHYLGACDYVNTEILLKSDLQDTKKEQVFVHELLHAVYNEAGFDEQDEDVINRVAIVLYQVLKNNNLRFDRPPFAPNISLEPQNSTPLKGASLRGDRN